MKQNYLKKLMTALLLLCCTVVNAQDFEVDDICYNILSEEDKTVEVTRGNNEHISAATIPASVTYKSITYSVTSIGRIAFYDCYFLRSVEIPSSVTSIGDGAFSSCDRLTNIVVDEGNTVYDSRNNCNAIIETASNTLIAGGVNTIIPEGVTSIGSNAFAGRVHLTSIVIPEGVTSIGDGAFYSCIGLTSIVIPASVTSIGSDAFSGCHGLTSVTIGNGVTSIGDEAFSWCSRLTSIVIPEGVTSIGVSAFFACSGLTSIVIPASVTSIDGNAFSSCSGLTSITSHIAAENLFILVSNPFNGVNLTKCILYVPAGAKSTYESTVGWRSFKNIVEMSSDGSDATAIESVESEQGEAVYYDLSGRRVQNPANGIYIVNGRKVFIK